MTVDLVVVGAGGFGREVIDVMDAVNAAADAPLFSLRGVVDDSPSGANLQRLQRRGIEFLGSVDEYLTGASSAQYSVGIGAPGTRRTIADRFERAGWKGATLVHPSATTGFDVTFGAGSVICAGVRLTNNITAGRHVHLNLNATVGHDSAIGDFVSVNPLASISGDVTIGDDVLVGVSAVILQGRKVGAGATVGGSACVVSDVAGSDTVIGVPASSILKGGSR